MKKKSPDDGNGPKKATPTKKATVSKSSASEEASDQKQLPPFPTKVQATTNPMIMAPKRTGITQITIENFKGIADKVEIPIRPITLLFGANSSGKSTILQALLYLSELLEGRNPDADRLAPAGDSLDLGGFQEFVHARKTAKSVRIGVTLRLDDDGLPESRQTSNPSVPDYDLTSPEADHVRDATVTVEVAWSNQYQKPFITSYEVELDGTPFAAIHAQPGFEAHLDFINPDHPVFQQDPDGGRADEATNLFGALQSIYLDRNGAGDEADCGPDMRDRQRLAVGKNVIPDFILGLPDAWSYQPQGEEEAWGAAWLVALLNRTVVGAGRLLMEELRGIRYIGPIRRTPERNFQPIRSPGADRWADGSGAWDLICLNDSPSKWLDERLIKDLGLGVKLEKYQYYEVPMEGFFGDMFSKFKSAGLMVGLVDIGSGRPSDGDLYNEIRQIKVQIRIRLISEKTGFPLQPCEVGVGVSQCLPVVLGAMAPGGRILAVEQPELHIHPAIQCNLADLLAHQVIKDDNRTILLETHSEHLILRMLRRIRENTEGELPEDAPALAPEHLSVLWVEQDEGVVSIKSIPVNSQGDFDEQWPKGFFEERFDEYE
jgi:hypothetical protein